MTTTHIPKGGMCTTCANGSKACADLQFASMRPIQRYPDGITAVKCTGHSAPAAAPPLCISCGARNHPLPDGSLPCGH